MPINNFYNPSNPWVGNNGGTMNNTSGTVNPNGNYQSPGYAGFNNFQRPSVPSMLPGRQVANADLRTQVQAFNLAVSQRNQNDYLIDKLQPCPTPAYVVPNPNCCYNYGNFGFNNGCGCNNGCC